MAENIPKLDERIKAFVALGEQLRFFINDEQSSNIGEHGEFSLQHFNKSVADSQSNPWFTKQNLRSAISSWAEALTEDSLTKWIMPYRTLLERNVKTLRVAVIMAGNVPMVGMHDFISTLVVGHHFTGKLSSNDSILIPAIARMLIEIEPGFENLIRFTDEQLNGFDAVIATGSNNTSRYFEYYFSKFPHIIRKSRNSIAILDGSESEIELKGLVEDISLYFGLGCRNVSKLYLPEEYDFQNLLNVFLYNYDGLYNHYKYMNNYIYQKTIYQMTQKPFYDNGVVLFVESAAYSSPIAVINYEFYNSVEFVKNQLINDKELLQCVVGHSDLFQGIVPFGSTQKPQLWDYADDIDTLQFLLNL